MFILYGIKKNKNIIKEIKNLASFENIDSIKESIRLTYDTVKVIIDIILKLTDREILQDAGKISHKIACDKAESEFEKYRIIQDQIYISDFDKYINELEKLDAIDKSE